MVIAHLGVPKATVMVPIEWQYSVEKLFAEFVSINYLTWDLSQMTPTQAAKEFFRRMEAIATRKKAEELRTIYSTPQPGFFCENMLKFNELVIQAIACPPRIPMHMVNKLHPDAETEQIQDLKWIWGMEKICFLDHVTTEMIRFNVVELKEALQNANDRSFGAWDDCWLQNFSEEAFVLRILYQVRPVILQNMAEKSDAYIRQAINAYQEAKRCEPGTLEELDTIRKAVNKYQKGERCGGRFYGRKPFRKAFYEGLNVQAWPMPSQGHQWRRYEPVNHPVPLNPHEILDKAKDVKREVKDEPTMDIEREVDPTVMVTYKKLPETG